MAEDTADSYICNKCFLKCYKIKRERSFTDSSSSENPQKKVKTSQQEKISPSTVSPPLARTSQGHSYCFVCKKPGPKLVVLSVRARFLAFTKSDIFISSGARCCPRDVQNDILSPHALSILKPVKDNTVFSCKEIMELLQEANNPVLQQEKKRLDFDDRDGLSNDDYYNLTGLSKDNFDDLMGYITAVKSSKARSTRTCIALLLTKLRIAMSNKLLGTLFNMTKSQVRRAVSSGRKALLASFVTRHLGFQHISREEVKTYHTSTLAKELLTGSITSDPAILVLDGTYVYIQKSADFNFQRRSFSRPLVKPMMVVTISRKISDIIIRY